jgi:hypothetical protein
MKQLDRIISGLLIAIGLLQWIATPIFFRQFEEPAAWFFNGGITLIFLGAFNLLRIRYGNIAPGLKSVCLAANLIMLSFWIVMAIGLWYKFLFLRYPAAFFVIVVIAAATVLSGVSCRRGTKKLD